MCSVLHQWGQNSPAEAKRDLPSFPTFPKASQNPTRLCRQSRRKLQASAWMKHICLAGAFCCTKHSKAPGSNYAAVHDLGRRGGKLGTKVTRAQGRPGRAVLSARPTSRAAEGGHAPAPPPRPPDLLRPAAPATALQSLPLYLARRSAAPRSPSRDPHTRPAAAGSIAPQAGRSHADLCGSGALAGSRRADRAALAARPPSIRAEARCSRLGRRLILRTRRRDAQTQSCPGSSAGLAVSLKAL